MGNLGEDNQNAVNKTESPARSEFVIGNRLRGSCRTSSRVLVLTKWS